MTIPEHLANRDLDSSILEPVSEPPPRARVVIVGGGVIGSSIAYHLTKLGITDVLVVERTRLTAGTTWHAAGLVSQVRGTHALTELVADQRVAVRIASGRDRRRHRVPSGRVAHGRAHAGTDAGAARQRRHAPRVRRGGACPRAGPGPGLVADRRGRRPGGRGRRADRRHGEPRRRDARAGQGRARPRRRVRLRRDRDRVPHGRGGAVTGVETDKGTIEADTVVLAAGPVDLGAGQARRHLGLAVPGRARVGHDRARRGRRGTVPDPARPRRLLLRAAPRRVARGRRVRAEGQAEAAGRRAERRLRGVRRGLGPLRAGARRRARAAARAARHRVHALPARARELHARRELPHRRVPRGEEPVRGGRAELAGDHLRPRRRQGAVGVDRRGPPDDGPDRGRHRADGPLGEQPTRGCTRRRTRRSGRLYAMHWPALQSDYGRGVRRSPLLPQLRAAGAAVGEAAGWDRAAWFEPGARAEPLWIYDFDRPSWFAPVGEEMQRDPRGRGAVRPLDVREVRRAGARGARRAAAPVHVERRRRDRTRGVHAAVQRARRHRDGPDRHAPGRGPVPGARADAVPTADRDAAAQRAPERAPPSPT